MDKKEYGYSIRTSFMPRWRREMPLRFRLPFIRRQVDKIVDLIIEDSFDPIGFVYFSNKFSKQYMSYTLGDSLKSKAKEKGYGTIWLTLALMVLQYLLPLLLQWWINRRESSSSL